MFCILHYLISLSFGNNYFGQFVTSIRAASNGLLYRVLV